MTKDRADEIKAKCEAATGWKCTLGCTRKCKKAELDKQLVNGRRRKRAVAKANADRYAAKVEALGAEINRAKRENDSRLVAQQVAMRILKKKPKALQDEKHGYDGQRPVVRNMKVQGAHGVMVNVATRGVAEMRRRDDSFTEDMEKAAIKLEHDWRLVNEPALRGQAMKEFVDGAGHGVDPNIPVMEAGARLKAAEGALGPHGFSLLVLIFVKGDPVREIAKGTKESHQTISSMAKEALNVLAIHYGFVRSHLSQRRLNVMQERIEQWRRTIR